MTAAVTAGGGTIGGAASTTLTTAADGSVSTTWVLGPTPGVQTIRGSVSATQFLDVNVTATALPASQLAITTQPAATATVAVPLTQQPVIQLKDASGANAATSGVPVTAAVASGGGTLGGTTTVLTDASGTATFTNLMFTGAAGTMTLSFGATLNGTAASIASQAIVVSPAPPTQLAIATQPAATAVVGVPLTTQPAIQLKDAGGNNSLTSGVVVTASVASGGGTLGGTVTATTNASGVATFTNLAVSGVVGTVTLNFAATLNGSPASVVSQGIVVSTPPTIYWSLFSGPGTPQIQLAALPLTAGSSLTTVPSSAGLQFTAGMTFDASGRLWIISYPQAGGVVADVFTPPVTAASVPSLVFTLPASGDIDFLRFDNAGNLWASDYANKLEYEFAPPFTASRTLVPTVTLALPGFSHPSGMAVDAVGNVYVSNVGSTGTNSIAVFKAPITSASTPAYFLNGLTAPGGLIIDAQGNLYASNQPPGGPASIVRYNSNNLVSGALPDIVDHTGLGAQNYEAEFAFDAAGNLFVADCGNAGAVGIRSYPTATNAFSATLAPSATYTNANINSVGCVWGIAIH